MTINEEMEMARDRMMAEFEAALESHAWYVVMPDGRLEWLSGDNWPDDVKEYLLGDIFGDAYKFLDQLSVWEYFDEDLEYVGDDDYGIGVAVLGFNEPSATHV